MNRLKTIGLAVPFFLFLFNTVFVSASWAVWQFVDSGQSLATSASSDVALGDVDLDGDLDAFVANYDEDFFGPANRVWLNDGSGIFTDSGQSLGSSDSRGAALGDVDGDGDLDAFVANFYEQPNKVYKNMKVCYCDLNQDGKCDMQDWLIFGKEWGETGCDLNQSAKSIINQIDLLKEEIKRLKSELAGRD